MASLTEGFEKLRRWKNRSTVLNVTVVESGRKVHRHVGQVFGIDEEQCLVGIILQGSHDHFQLDLREADFVIGERALERKTTLLLFRNYKSRGTAMTSSRPATAGRSHFKLVSDFPSMTSHLPSATP
jgi:hypothetical protein